MLTILQGNRTDCMKELKRIASDLPIEYRQENTKKREYGLLYKPSVVYFLYDNQPIEFWEALETAKTHYVCICEITLDKRTAFYKKYKTAVKVCGTNGDIDNYQAFKQDELEGVAGTPEKDIVSLLYALFYKERKYKSIASDLILAIVSGQITTAVAKKYLLLAVAK